MPLQSSGNISAGQIQTEFGGTNPISISEYYGAASGVPASGQISWSDFHGTSAVIPLAVTNPNPSSVGGVGVGQIGGTVITISNPTSVTASGGGGGYLYLWQRVSGSTEIGATLPNSNSTSFSAGLNPTLNGDVTVTGVWRCRVTDSSNNQVFSSNINVTLTSISDI